MSALAFIAAALPVAIWVVMQNPGEDWWLGAALVYAPKMQWIALPVLGLIVAIIAWRPRLMLLNLAAAAFALFVVADYHLNAPPPLPENRPIIRLATWNVYGWTKEREVVRDRIMSWDADVVCLQESARPMYENLLPGYDSASVQDLRIFVRGRILSTEKPPDPGSRLHRMLLCAVETDAGRFTVVNVHLPRTEESRSTPREIGPLIDYIATGVEVREQKFGQLLALLPPAAPLIVAGDMNTPPASRYYDRMAARMTDSFGAVGRGFGNTFVWRRKLPVLRIDYVWTNGGIDPLRCEIQHHHPSDHRPIITELALPGGDLEDD